jgi:putative effector of murein hydrolase
MQREVAWFCSRPQRFDRSPSQPFAMQARCHDGKVATLLAIVVVMTYETATAVAALLSERARGRSALARGVYQSRMPRRSSFT